jgi:hypothetical protein
MTTTTTNGNGTTEAKTLTDDEKSTLWAALDEAQDTLEEAKREVISCERAVSNACTDIVKATGKTGFIRKGERIKFKKRKKSDLYFVAGQNEELEEVGV